MNKVNVYWLIQDRVIAIETATVLDKSDALQMNSDIIALLNASTHPQVHILFLSKRLKEFPSNLIWLQKNFTCVRHPKYGRTVSITESFLVRFVGVTLFKIFGVSVPRIVPSYGEAVQLLQQIDPTLPPFPDSIGE